METVTYAKVSKYIHKYKVTHALQIRAVSYQADNAIIIQQSTDRVKIYEQHNNIEYFRRFRQILL